MYKKYTKEIGMSGRRIKKVWLIMRLTTILLIVTFLQVSATGLAQKITLSKKQASLKAVLKELKAQSGYTFISTESLYKKSKPVDITVYGEDFQAVMDKIFAEQPLSYTVYKKTVTIKEKEQSLINNLKEQIKLIDVSGKVTDAQGQPLLGATVTVKGENISTTTDTKGGFILKKISENAVLQISFIGYLTQELNANADLGNIKLEQSNSKLDEVQVIAYGTTSRRLNTGNVSSIKATDIEKQPVSNPLLALAGRIPSLQIIQNNGLPGSAVSVRIQGENSLTKGSNPYYVIDGVPYSSQLINNLAGGLLGTIGGTPLGNEGVGGGNPLNYINPSDIESIDVLKDADATAIYGSRAANGAILITTKKGKAGQSKVDFSIQQGIGQVARRVKMMNTQEYLQMRRDAYKNDGVAAPTISTPPDYSNYDLTVYDQNRNTDWQKELIGGTANYTDIHTAISGGNVLTSFRVTGGYHKETTVFPGDFSDVKGSFGFHINHQTTNQRFKIQVSGSYLNDRNSLPTTDLTQTALNIAPNAPALYKADGSLNWQRIQTGSDSTSTWQNPLALLQNTYLNKTNNLIGSAQLSYQILPGLEVNSNFGYTNLTSKESNKYPLTAYTPEDRLSNVRFASYGYNSQQSWIIEPQLHFSRQYNKNKLDFLLGSTFQQNTNSGLQLYGNGFNSDQVMDDILSAPTTGVASTIESSYKYSAIFGRINYNLSDKYLLNVTYRRDGSSRFGPNSQFHNFGAIGAAWIFSGENFIKRNFHFLSFGKLKGSYGTTGNDQIGNYQFLSLYQPVSGVTTSYQNSLGLVPKGHSNPYLQWEETRKIQGGIDLGFFEDRVLISANYYSNRSSNQLLGYTLPAMTGFQSVLENLPATIQNTGIEVSLTTNVIRNKNFSWTSSFNLTIPRNKLVEFANLEKSSYKDQFILGQPVDITKTFLLAGVDPQTGDYKFYSADGSTTYSPSYSSDRLFNYSPTPKFQGGFQNTVTYKSLTLDFLFQFVKQTGNNLLGYYFYNGAFFGGDVAAAQGNLPEYFLNSWKFLGDNASIAKPSTGFSSSIYNGFQSNLGIGDASYIRLKNISLSYVLPMKWKDALHAQSLRMFLQGQNILTVTNFKGLDPENKTSGLPPLRVVTMGLQVTF